jgi:serine/threonine protein kinase
MTGSIETFSEGSEHRRSFLSGLASVLAIPQRQIVIISVRSGSVIVELAFLRESTSSASPVDITLRLKEAFFAGKLETFSATGLMIGGQSVNMPVSSSQLPLIIGASIGGFILVVMIFVATKKACVLRTTYNENMSKAATVEDLKQKHLMHQFLDIHEADIQFDSSFAPISGSFGDIRKGVWNGIPVAVKTLKNPNLTQVDRDNFNCEVKLMHAINHPNCVRLYGVCSTDTKTSLVMEWMDGHDLSRLLSQTPPPPMHRRVSLFRQICAGLCYLHTQKSIVHSDIEAANIMLSADRKTAKIIYFGLSKIKQGAANIAGTINYLPPERVLKQAVADRSADVYAMGVLLWEMISCSVMWQGMNVQDIFLALLNNNRPAIPADADADVAHLIQECWATDAAARPTALDLSRRLSILDLNNLEFNKALHPYSPLFIPTCFTLEDCLRKALEPATCDSLLFDLHMVNSKYIELPLQAIVQLCCLTEVEAKCIIVCTMESKRVSKSQQLFKLFCQAYRQRNEEALDAFADFSFHFWNGLSKLPDHAVPLYRGLDKRLAHMNDLYHVGNIVHWHYPSSCTTDKVVASRFSNGGTLLSLNNVIKAKCIQAFSLIPSEREFLIDFTSVFDVSIALTCVQAKSLQQFSSDLPDNVDLVVLSARAPALPHAVVSFDVASAPPLTLAPLQVAPHCVSAHPLLPQPAVSPAVASHVLHMPSAPPLSLILSRHVSAAPPLTLTHSLHFTRVSPALPLPHDYTSSAQSSRQPSSLELLHLPHLARLDSDPAAEMGFRDARCAIIPPPVYFVDALVLSRHVAVPGPLAAAANVGILHADASVALEDVRLGGMGGVPADAAAAFRQC